MRRLALLRLLLILSVPLQSSAQKDTLFWFAAPEISASAGDSPIYLRFLSYDAPAAVSITQPANAGFVPITLNLTAQGLDSVNLTSLLASVESPAANIVSNNGLKITSTAPISAFYELRSTNREVFSLKGNKANGTNFYTPFQTFWDNGVTTPASFSAIDIVATQNNTTVLITPRTAITGHAANVSFSILLQAGQTYSARDMNTTAATTLAGSIVSANKPIAVTLFSGALTNGCLSPMGEQITSTTFIGTDYIIRKGTAADRIYILATQNATALTISGTSVTTTLINSGETYSYAVTDSVHFIHSGKPVYVWHVSGHGCKISGTQVPNVLCAGTYSAAFTRTQTDSLALILYTRSGYENQFAINGSSSLVPPSAFATVPGTSGAYKAALIYLTTTDIPLNSYNIVTNSGDIFGLGILAGNSTSGSSYSYFSEFTSYPFAHAGTDDTTCANVPFALNGAVGGGTVTGQWSSNGFGSFQLSTSSLANQYIPSPLDTLISPVRIILTSTGGCSVKRDTLMLEISPAPIVNAFANQTVCANNAVVQLNGTVSGGALTGTWTTSGSGTFSPDSTALNATYTPSAADKTAGMATLVLTSTNDGGCGTVSDNMVVSITQPAVVTIAADTLYTCSNNADAQLSGTVTGSSSTGKWITSGTGGFSPDNLTLNAIYQPSTADISNGSVTLYLESTNNGNCLPVRDSLKLFFTASPTIDAGANIISCTNTAAVTLNGSIGGSSSTGVWTGGNGIFTADSTTLNATYTPTATEISSGGLILVLTSTNNGTCDAVSDQLQITFSPPPFANFNFTNVCLNNTSVFTDFSLPGFGTLTNWDWDFGDGQTSSMQHPGHTYGSPGMYNVSLITTTTVGCSDTIMRQVTVYSPPTAGFTYTASCNGGDQVVVNFVDASVSGDAVIFWFYDFGGQGSAASPNPTQLFVGNGNFTISQIVQTVNGCRDTLIQVITIPPQPVAGFSYNSSSGMNIGAVFNFVETSSYANTYSWTFGDGNTSTLPNPDNIYFSNGDYLVTLVVTGDLGCIDSASVNVNINTVTHDITTLIPNAISPNGDGKNDVWKLAFIKLMYPNAEVSVYNQWGQELYYSVGYPYPWTGYYRGEPVPDGTYFYVIKLNDNSDNPIYKGSILVMKNAN